MINYLNFQAEAEEALPEQQMGFRRILAGIYTQTGAHIVGAPMAHYNAINGSRFKFSLDRSYLPVHGLEGILKERNVVMTFKNLNGKQVAFHKAFNYLYRPAHMEQMPLYKFYSETKFVNISEARKAGTEYFEYTETHIFHKSEGVVYRTTDAVPTFPWTWLGSTKPFLTSILHPANNEATDHQKKEEYAFRFMLLFVPFRSRDDLQPDGGFYQNALQKAYEDGRITNDMIEIAENIQTIHNSLASRIPENSLSADTKLTETGAFENANGDDDNDDDDDYEDLLASIGELFLTLKDGDGLNADSECLDIQFGDKQMEPSASLSTTELENVIEFIHLEDNQGDIQQQQYATERFCSTTDNLNTLALRTRITRTQANEAIHATEKEIVIANGTWQSISRWGENEGLDGDQQTAFEILAAVYVLSFYDEAIVEATNSVTYEEFVERKKGLCQLARRDTNSEKPLCMFITGPAGAGKCKF
jgi:hypothetical protein